MKFLTTSVLKLIVLLLSIFNIALVVVAYLNELNIISALYFFFIFQTLIGLLYVSYMSSIRWLNENINDLKNRLENSTKILNEKVDITQKQLLAELKNISQLQLSLNELTQENERLRREVNPQFIHEQLKKSQSDSKLLLNRLNYQYDRLDALFSIHQLIKLRSPLPIMHDWAVSSDYAHLLLKTALNNKGIFVDIGSGISTLLLGYAVEYNGLGKVISLEHDEEYYEKTKALINEHALEQYVDLNYCPLIDIEIKGETWKWYDISKIDLPDKVTLISVDGPPGHIQPLSRYPAVPMLKNCIDSQTIIFLDDGKRKDEIAVADRWEEETSLKKEFIDSFKGIFKLFK